MRGGYFSSHCICWVFTEKKGQRRVGEEKRKEGKESERKRRGGGRAGGKGKGQGEGEQEGKVRGWPLIIIE